MSPSGGRHQAGTISYGGHKAVSNAVNTGSEKHREFVSRPAGAPSVAGMVESIVGCKWSMSVLMQIRAGVVRPGKLEKAIEGISTKVLSERLDKLLRFGLIERESFAEVPPRVEYRLTALGRRFCVLVDEVDKLERELAERSSLMKPAE